MAYSHRIRGRAPSADYWPGFVDAMATLLLVLIFLLSVFMLTQFFLAQAISGKDATLDRLRSQIAELADLLALEKREKASLEATVAALTDTLATAETERARLNELIGAQKGAADRVGALETELERERQASRQAVAQLELMNQQIAALRRQLATLESALEAAERKDREAQTQIADLGRRLNAALAQKVQELARYRSDFFGRLRDVLGNRADIEIVGDRFVFQSEVLFDSGSAAINPSGQRELEKVAAAIKDVAAEIPSDINWVLRVDGHTDANPIATPQFPSNWVLSSARAISVVEFLIDQGVEPDRLVAAGFGEFQPLGPGDDPAAYRRNRRIEFKLTER